MCLYVSMCVWVFLCVFRCFYVCLCIYVCLCVFMCVFVCLCLTMFFLYFFIPVHDFILIHAFSMVFAPPSYFVHGGVHPVGLSQPGALTPYHAFEDQVCQDCLDVPVFTCTRVHECALICFMPFEFLCVYAFTSVTQTWRGSCMAY